MAESCRSVDDEDRFIPKIGVGKGEEKIGLTVEYWCDRDACKGRLFLYIQDWARGDIQRVGFCLLEEVLCDWDLGFFKRIRNDY